MSFWENFIEYVYMIGVGAAAIFSIRVFRKKVSIAWKVYAVFLIVSFLIECYAFYIAAVYKKENQYLYNWLLLFENPVKIFLFYAYTSHPLLKKIVLGSGIALIIFSVFNAIYLQPNADRLYTNIVIIGGLIVMIWAIVYYAHIYLSERITVITADPVFWIATAALITSAPMLPFFGMLNYLVENYREFAVFYLVYVMNFFFILARVCIILSFLKLYHASAVHSITNKRKKNVLLSAG